LVSVASKKSSRKPSVSVKKSLVKTAKVKAKVKVQAKAKVTARKPVVAKTPVIAKKIVPAKIARPPVSVKSAKAAKTAVAAKPVNPVMLAIPGKNQAGLSVKSLEQYRAMLLGKRRELLGDVSSMEDEALRSDGQSNLSNLPIHMADMGTDNYEQEFTLGLVEKDRNLLRDINIALAKINAGTYGICEGTGKPINKARLDAQPWARFSIEYTRTLEQRRMRA
jgi:DnaK suppressor protein